MEVQAKLEGHLITLRDAHNGKVLTTISVTDWLKKRGLTDEQVQQALALLDEQSTQRSSE